MIDLIFNPIMLDKDSATRTYMLNTYHFFSFIICEYAFVTNPSVTILRNDNGTPGLDSFSPKLPVKLELTCAWDYWCVSVRSNLTYLTSCSRKVSAAMDAEKIWAVWENENSMDSVTGDEPCHRTKRNEKVIFSFPCKMAAGNLK